MEPGFLQITATVVFALAVLHTFSIKRFQHIALKCAPGSVGENFFHLMGEVEIVFGLWAGVLILITALFEGGKEAVEYVESLNFTEPAFVFVIMAMAATRPIIWLASRTISIAASTVPVPKAFSFYATTLIAGPLLGSFITEPAAMTVTAIILKKVFFDHNVSLRFKYLSLAVLFVNISIGGVLTHFAAPPVVMVSGTWNWGTAFMFSRFGWKAIIAVVINTALALVILRKELAKEFAIEERKNDKLMAVPWWLALVHIGFLLLVVLTSHHSLFFMGLFLFFIGTAMITQEYQEELKLRESLLVGFFLGGLVILGSFQSWWLKPLIENLNAGPLFVGSAILTGFVDNAALTYLGSQVSGITEFTKYALLAGAVSGGGLTVIANAPNPAGFAILKESFGPEGISPVHLFLYALVPTCVAMGCFWFLP
ncbi:MAG: putative Na+/H+ antiporter [Deltaproteobacteria bacterium]|nr:putative Na+/H+ antiporter [Deltaproteobacteria bacterium]